MDERSGQARITIAAAPEAVWDLIADVTRMGEWSPETTGCEWIEGADGPRVGARFKGHSRRGRAKGSTTCKVTAAERPRACLRGGRCAGADDHMAVPVRADRRRRDRDRALRDAKPVSRFDRLVTRVTTGVGDRRADMEAGAAATLAALKRAAESG